jgi:hypothetical protein
MSILGGRDNEPPAEEAHEGQAAEHRSQAGAHDTQEPVTEHPADAPPSAYGSVPPAADAAQAGARDSGIAPQRWSEILVSFVDDPRGSVTMAADAVDEAIGEFVNSVRARQRVLASSWQGTETGTEQLRTALRDYRKFWHQVQQLDLGEKTGA